ncbi:MAG: nucleotide exchange factor GrpE [Bacteroidota bacterium]
MAEENQGEQKNGSQDQEPGSAENHSEEQTTAGSENDRITELNEKYVRLYAEFDNYRKRTNREKIELINSAGEGIIKDLLPVLDDFERAIVNNENAADLESVKEGFHLIFHKMRHILDNKGLKPMEVKGHPFDSELHEAIANVPAPSDEMKGKVIEDVEKGYLLNEKVIRYAKVVVGQ